jgi:hypothetical protein
VAEVEAFARLDAHHVAAVVRGHGPKLHPKNPLSSLR